MFNKLFLICFIIGLSSAINIGNLFSFVTQRSQSETKKGLTPQSNTQKTSKAEKRTSTEEEEKTTKPTSDTAKAPPATNLTTFQGSTNVPNKGVPMRSQNYTVIKNTTLRNTNTTEALKECEYIRDWEASYVFKSMGHDKIFYYSQQCLDDRFKIIKQIVKFNYDYKKEERKLLPEGCPPPMIEDRRTNPCENGIALGTQLYRDVAQIVTKQVYHNPVLNSSIDADTPVDKDGFAALLHTLPQLQKMINETLKESMTGVDEKTAKTKEVNNNSDGTYTELYMYPDGTRGSVTRLETNGQAISSTLYKTDGDKIVVTVLFKPYRLKKEKFDENGNLISYTMHTFKSNPYKAYVPGPNEKNPLLPNVVTHNEDRSQSIRNADGSVQTLFNDGTKILEYLNGSGLIIHPEPKIPDTVIPAMKFYPTGGKDEVTNADGSKTKEISITTPKPYTFVLTIYTDGTKVINYKSGIKIILTDNTTIWVGKTGQGVIYHPNGKTTRTKKRVHPLPKVINEPLHHLLGAAVSTLVSKTEVSTKYRDTTEITRRADGTVTILNPLQKGESERKIEKTFAAAIPQNPWEYEEITFYNSAGDQVGDKYMQPNPYFELSYPLNYDIPQSIVKELDKAADNMAALLDEFINKKINCFLEKTYTRQENYLTFVCAKSQNRTIRDAVKQEFKNDLVCQTIDCEKIQNELIDKMLAASNAGASKKELKALGQHGVKSESYTDIYIKS